MQKRFKKKKSNPTFINFLQDSSSQNQQQNQFDNRFLTTGNLGQLKLNQKINETIQLNNQDPLLSREQKVDHFIQKKAQRRKLGQLKLGQKINETIQLNNQDIIRNIRKYSGNNQIKPSNASFDQNKALLQQTYVNF